MPLPVDNLTKDSTPQAIKAAIAASIEACMKEPTPEGYDVPNKQEWCAGKCYGIAKRNTGKEA